MNRIFDLLFLIFLLPFLLPIFFIVLFLALIFHGKSVFFSQMRVGRNKKPFRLYKFRSMIHGAQNMGTGLYSYEDDNRITPFGKFIRKTSLDEFPQLFNVIKGDMSFVGPRPAVVGELEEEKDLPQNVNERFSIRPGLTGWAQIHGRDNLSWKEKIEYDIEFVRCSKMKKVYLCVFIILFTPFYLLNSQSTSQNNLNTATLYHYV